MVLCNPILCSVPDPRVEFEALLPIVSFAILIWGTIHGVMVGVAFRLLYRYVRVPSIELKYILLHLFSVRRLHDLACDMDFLECPLA